MAERDPSGGGSTMQQAVATRMQEIGRDAASYDDWFEDLFAAIKKPLAAWYANRCQSLLTQAARDEWSRNIEVYYEHNGWGRFGGYSGDEYPLLCLLPKAAMDDNPPQQHEADDDAGDGDEFERETEH